jgi:hypothetical protein
VNPVDIWILENRQTSDVILGYFAENLLLMDEMND